MRTASSPDDAEAERDLFSGHPLRARRHDVRRVLPGARQLGWLPRLHEGVLHRHPMALVVLTVALGLAAGALWELYEWAASSVFSHSSIAVGYDALLDLVMDGSGSVAAACLLLRWRGAGLTTGRTPG